MNSPVPEMSNGSRTARIQEHVEREIDTLVGSFPSIDGLSAKQRREIIARYCAVLEGNFIYWMTGALLSVRSEEARAKILENLHEEVRDAHPLMLRKFAISAHAVPTDSDALAMNPTVTNMRLFIGRLNGVPIIVTMAFFEGFIQRFMAYLADLARRQGSAEMEYTDVHGVCDITHTQELYRALEAEMQLADGTSAEKELFEGVSLLRELIENVIWAQSSAFQVAV